MNFILSHISTYTAYAVSLQNHEVIQSGMHGLMLTISVIYMTYIASLQNCEAIQGWCDAWTLYYAHSTSSLISSIPNSTRPVATNPTDSYNLLATSLPIDTPV